MGGTFDVGKRTAQRLLVDLKARLEVPDFDLVEASGGPASPRGEVRDALVGLGYSSEEVRTVIGQLAEDGTVLLKVEGLRFGTGVSASGRDAKILAERLLTVEWRHRELPEAEQAAAGNWLLVSSADMLKLAPPPPAVNMSSASATPAATPVRKPTQSPQAL